jgi:hypothetical protein
MNRRTCVLFRLALCALLACGMSVLVGCSREGRKVEDFTPPADTARQALEAALNHWKSGQPPGKVPNTSPAVEVTDSKWKGGQKLKGFEILGEEPGTDPRFFKVRLTPPTGPAQEVKYAVVGIDPLLVFREEDFKALSGMGK